MNKTIVVALLANAVGLSSTEVGAAAKVAMCHMGMKNVLDPKSDGYEKEFTAYATNEWEEYE